MTRTPRIAIIGTGISGLGCAHFLHRDFDLTLFEQNDYAGGHTNTVTVEDEGQAVPVDTGFMVFNHVTYPLLTRLFKELEVKTQPTDMSFSVTHAATGFEYNGSSVNTLFGQRSNLFKPRFWKFLKTIARFNAEAVAALEDPRFKNLTLAEYCRVRGYGADFLEIYLVPMSSAVWSTPPDRMRDFPALTLLRFWHNHGFLGMHTQHPWWTVSGGSQSYVRSLTAPFRERVQVSHAVAKVERIGSGVKVTPRDGEARTFDKVIFASHADQSLALLADPTPDEQRLLGPFRYQPNVATLHTDERFMPATPRCWASWNYRVENKPDAAPASTHYWMNRLQRLPSARNFFVSINADHSAAPEQVRKTIHYEHPLFDLAAIRAQQELPRLNQISSGQTTYFCGSYFRYGFHEDGFASAVALCRDFLGKEPW